MPLFKDHVHPPVAILAAVETAMFVFPVYAGATIRFGGSESNTKTGSDGWLNHGLLFALIMILRMVATGPHPERMQSTSPATVVGIRGSILFFYLINLLRTVELVLGGFSARQT